MNSESQYLAPAFKDLSAYHCLYYMKKQFVWEKGQGTQF